MFRRLADDAIVIIHTCVDYRARQSSPYVLDGSEFARSVGESFAELSREGLLDNADVARFDAWSSQDIY